MILAAAANLFPPTRYLLRRLIPRRILSKQKQHTDFTNAKVLQRLELKTSRPDFITPFLAELRTAPEKMSLGEIQSTFAILIIAGSESVATTLMGVFFYLAKNEEVQGRLAAVLRARFEREGDITVEATKGIAYLDGVISEALRLCFPVPGGLPRVVPEGGDVYAGHYVPGGVS